MADLDITAGLLLDFGELNVDRSAIRNVVDVEYGAMVDDVGAAEDPDSTGEPLRKKKTASDATSIAKYGRRYCRIGIGSTGQIDTATEAQRLADSVLHDLRDPKAHGTAELLARFGVDIENMVRVRADGRRFAEDEDFSVVNYRTVLSRDKRRTTLTVRAANPIGGWRRWLDGFILTRGSRPGRARRPLAQPAAPTLTSIAEGLLVEWDHPGGKLARRYRSTEVHTSTVSGYTPSAATLRANVPGNSVVLKGLAPTTAQYVVIVHRDSMRNTSLPSDEAISAARFLPRVPGVRATLSSDLAGAGSGKHHDYFTGSERLDTKVQDHFGNYDDASAGTFEATNDGFHAVAAGIEAEFASAQTVQPLLLHRRAGVVIGEIVGAAGAAGTQAFGQYPPSAFDALSIATFGDRVLQGGLLWMLAGDTLSLGYRASGNPTAIKATASTYLAVAYFGGGE